MTSADFDAAFFLRLDRAGAEVGSQGETRVLAEGVVGRERFGGKDVQRGGGDLARIERGQEVVFDHDFAAGAIDHADLGFHLGEGAGIEHAVRLVGDRQVDGDEIGIAVNVVEVRDEREAERFGALLGEEGVVGQDVHAEGQGAAGDLAADAAHAEDAEGLAHQLDALELLAIPFAGRHRGVGLGHLARQAQNQGEGKLGGRDGVAAGRIHDHHAALSGGLDIHVVHSHAGAADDPQLGRGLDDAARHLGLGAHHHGHDVLDHREQLRLGKPLGQHHDLELGPLLQQGNGLGR